MPALPSPHDRKPDYFPTYGEPLTAEELRAARSKLLRAQMSEEAGERAAEARRRGCNPAPRVDQAERQRKLRALQALRAQAAYHG